MPNKIKNSNIDTNAVTSDSISYPLTTFSSTGIDDNATSTAITIDSSQRVGIGESSPEHLLHISGSSGANDGSIDNQVTIRLEDTQNQTSGTSDSSNAYAALEFFSADTSDGARVQAKIGAKYGSAFGDRSDLIFYTAGAGADSALTERARIDNLGNLKVSRRGVALNVNSTHQMVDDLSNSYSLMLSNKAATPLSQYMLEIGFKSSSPDDNAARFIECLDSTTTRAQIMSDGDFRSHDNSYGSTSDERIKQDIVDATSQWEDVKAFRIRKYKKKDDVRQYGADEAKVHIGVIAQELETVSPGLIKEQEPGIGDIQSSSEFGELYQEGDTIPEGKSVGDIKTISTNVKSVNYSVLYMKSIKALQEAMTKIETLETENTSIKARLDALENA